MRFPRTLGGYGVVVGGTFRGRAWKESPNRWVARSVATGKRYFGRTRQEAADKLIQEEK